MVIYMIEIEKIVSLFPSGICYGGKGGYKKGIIINGERWFIKYLKSNFILEYLGSHIYELIGIEVQETKLIYTNNMIVTICKDFLSNYEIIMDYNMLRNEYNDKLEDLSSISKFEQVLIVMNENRYFKSFPKLKERFWDMFIIDAFIGNDDRGENDWGLILNKKTNDIRLAPVFDNDSSFLSESSDSLKYIESMVNEDCNKALLRIIPKIDINKIIDLFNDVPLKYNNLPVLSEVQRNYYLKSLEYKYNNILISVYNKVKKK